MNTPANGTINSSGVSVYGGTSIVVYTPNAGYEFSKVIIDNEEYGVGNYDGFTVSETNVVFSNTTENHTVGVKFVPIEYSITYTDCDEGMTNPNPTSFTVEDDTIELQPATREGYVFDKWTDTNGNKVTGISAGSTGDVALTANWTAAEYTTDANGKAHIYNPATGEYEDVTITDASGNPIAGATVSTTDDGTIKVQVPSEYANADVIVAVTDTNNKPVSGADVTLNGRGTKTTDDDGTAGWYLDKITDANGKAHIYNPATGEYEDVTITDASGNPIAGATVSATDDGTIKVQVPSEYANADVIVAVTDTNNKPVSGADVTLSGRGSKITGTDGTAGWYTDKVTDSNGKAHIYNPATGEYEDITITDASGNPIAGATVSATDDGTIKVQVPSEYANSDVIVKVTDTNNKPVSGADVTLSGRGTKTTDDDGTASWKTDDGKNTDDEQGSIATVWRLYNPTTSEHLFTTDKSEYNLLTQYGWKQENAAWYTPKTSSVGVYRLYNPALGAQGKMSHHYTTNKAECENLVKNYGWSYDNDAKPIFYSAVDENGKALSNAKSVYRLYNGGLSAHHYTLDASENKNLQANEGWSGEGVGFYAYDEKATKALK